MLAGDEQGIQLEAVVTAIAAASLVLLPLHWHMLHNNRWVRHDRINQDLAADLSELLRE